MLGSNLNSTHDEHIGTRRNPSSSRSSSGNVIGLGVDVSVNASGRTGVGQVEEARMIRGRYGLGFESRSLAGYCNESEDDEVVYRGRT